MVSKKVISRNANKVEEKVDAFLLIQDFPRALKMIADLNHKGAHIYYEPHDWKLMPNGFQVYSSAMVRHLMEEQLKDVDEETGMIPEVATAWNALARLELKLMEMEND